MANIEAPTGGWNTRDPLDSMAANDAVILDNFFPDNGSVNIRKGYKEYKTPSGNIRTLLNYQDEELFAVSDNGNIYTISGTVAAETLPSALTSFYLDYVIANGKMACVNGTEAPFEFDGTTWSAMSLSGTGLTPSNLNRVILFKGRAIYWDDSTLSFWYAGAGAYTGALTEFDLGLIAKKGGSVKEIFTLTHDGGDGVDDYFVIVTTTGETIVYQGSDPSSSTDWNLVGKYLIGEPIGGSTEMAGDQVILTKTGWVNFQSVFQTKLMSDHIGVGGKIAPSAQEAARVYGDNNGWQCLFYPKGTKLIINIPHIEGTKYVQHVMNTNTGAWCSYSGVNAQCFGIYQGDLYFGGISKVYQAETGTNDDGIAIAGDCVASFNAFGNPGIKKQLTAIQVVSNFNHPNNIGVNGSADFNIPAKPVIDEPLQNAPAEWDDGQWDNSNWGLIEGIHATNWLNTSAFGFFTSFRIIIKARHQTVKWYSTNVMIKQGGMV